MLPPKGQLCTIDLYHSILLNTDPAKPPIYTYARNPFAWYLIPSILLPFRIIHIHRHKNIRQPVTIPHPSVSKQKKITQTGLLLFLSSTVSMYSTIPFQQQKNKNAKRSRGSHAQHDKQAPIISKITSENLKSIQQESKTFSAALKKRRVKRTALKKQEKIKKLAVSSQLVNSISQSSSINTVPDCARQLAVANPRSSMYSFQKVESPLRRYQLAILLQRGSSKPVAYGGGW